MYDPIFAKSFSRYDRRRFRCFALLLSLIIALTICSTFKPTLHPLTIIGEAVRMQLSINAMEDLLIQDEIIQNSDNKIESLKVHENSSLELELPRLDPRNNSDNSNATAAAPEKELRPPQGHYSGEPLCRVLKANADFCEIEGDIRVDTNSSSIFLFTPENNTTSSWIIQPYPRKGIAFVEKWTVRVGGAAAVPECSKRHDIPALLFSIGGFTGNHFHDFADLLFPLFTTSFRYNGEVQFLASDYKPWWLSKYRPLLRRLSRRDILDVDHEQHVHCYSKLTAGLKFHRELVAEPSSETTMSQFRQLLRQTYALRRNTAAAKPRRGGAKPRLLIVARKRTRILINEGEVSRLARKMGYEVVSAESDVSSNLTTVAQLVNSCDVMVGVHGAGLTNMVFLPEKAVVIQILPLGAIDVFAKLDFGEPSKGMNLGYLDYKVGFSESSLSEKYSRNDPVIRDPLSIHRQGWGKLREVYLHNQNVTLDVRRFRGTLAKALKLLRR